MAKIDALKRLLREEFRAVLREELPRLLSEGKLVSSNYKDSLKKEFTSKIPSTLNTSRPSVVAPKVGNSMLNSMLYETAMDMQTPNEMSFDTTNVHSFAMMQNSEMGRPGVGSVNDMLASSRPSAAHEMVQVAQVPDFSELMDKMIEKGVM